MLNAGHWRALILEVSLHLSGSFPWLSLHHLNCLINFPHVAMSTEVFFIPTDPKLIINIISCGSGTSNCSEVLQPLHYYWSTAASQVSSTVEGLDLMFDRLLGPWGGRQQNISFLLRTIKLILSCLLHNSLGWLLSYKLRCSVSLWRFVHHLRVEKLRHFKFSFKRDV